MSWLDPFIILTQLYWSARWRDLGTAYHKHNTSVPAIDGRDHVMVSPRDSVLVVTFARPAPGRRDGSVRAPGKPAALVCVGFDECSGMIIGMLPMSLGLGEGGEQNAPLGCVSFGGLMIALLPHYCLCRGVQPSAPLFSHTVGFKTRKKQVRRKFCSAGSCDLAIIVSYDYNNACNH